MLSLLGSLAYLLTIPVTVFARRSESKTVANMAVGIPLVSSFCLFGDECVYGKLFVLLHFAVCVLPKIAQVSGEDSRNQFVASAVHVTAYTGLQRPWCSPRIRMPSNQALTQIVVLLLAVTSARVAFWRAYSWEKGWYAAASLAVSNLLTFTLQSSACRLLFYVMGYDVPTFYGPYWRATSVAGFWRAWNTPMQGMLHRVVYAPSVKYLKCGKFTASVLVFLASAAYHWIPLSWLAKRDSGYVLFLAWNGFFMFQCVLISGEKKLKAWALNVAQDLYAKKFDCTLSGSGSMNGSGLLGTRDSTSYAPVKILHAVDSMDTVCDDSPSSSGSTKSGKSGETERSEDSADRSEVSAKKVGVSAQKVGNCAETVPNSVQSPSPSLSDLVGVNERDGRVALVAVDTQMIKICPRGTSHSENGTCRSESGPSRSERESCCDSPASPTSKKYLSSSLLGFKGRAAHYLRFKLSGVKSELIRVVISQQESLGHAATLLLMGSSALVLHYAHLSVPELLPI